MNKILILHTSKGVGGAEYSLLKLLHNLGNLRAEWHIVLASSTPFYQQMTSLPIHCHKLSLPYLNNRFFTTGIPTVFHILLGSIKLYHLVKRKNINVIYCNTFRSLPYCLLSKWLTRIRIVCHCRDNVSSRWTRLLIQYLADETIAISEAIHKQLPVTAKSHIVYNGITPLSSSRNNSSEWLCQKYRIPKKIQLIGNIGQILPWKNQWDYLTVAERLLHDNKNLHFFLIGAVMDDNYYLRLKQRIRHMGLEAYFTFTGHVDHMVSYLSGLSVVLHTALNEPFGRILIEAAALSKPVIAYASGGPSEIIRNGKTGYLVQDREITKMTMLTAQLLSDPTLCKLMGQSAREHVIRQFNSWDYAHNIHQILTYDKSVV